MSVTFLYDLIVNNASVTLLFYFEEID